MNTSQNGERKRIPTDIKITQKNRDKDKKSYYNLLLSKILFKFY
ncbi:hypothetical protein GNY06_10400 [Elizabethkingia argentiflava]|uniref:Uncharacterized protein n=1 Tax=Elizabethkingia argenteiflava TaxID=2681556 RepID=A0A845PX20_9FLAO|nr:hypothetical protein [Elizabethkingia argenteiflava]